MNKETKTLIFKNAITGCAIPTCFINGILAFINKATEHTAASLQSDVIIGVFLTGIIITFFGPLMTMGLLKKNPNMALGCEQRLDPIAKILPNNIFLSAIVIAIIACLIFGCIPAAILMLFPNLVLTRVPFIIYKFVYTFPYVLFCAYLGQISNLYAKNKKGLVMV